MGSDCQWVQGFHVGDEKVLELNDNDGCTTIRIF